MAVRLSPTAAVRCKVPPGLLDRIDDWLGFDPVGLQHYGHFCIAGGFVRDFIADVTASDMDIFFKDETAFERIYSVMLASGMFEEIVNTTNAVTLKGKTAIQPRIQLIKRVYGDAFEIIDAFDFICCMGAVEFAADGEISYVTAASFEYHVRYKILQFGPNPNTTNTALSELKRLLKLSRMGYRAPTETCLEMTRRLQEVDLSDSNAVAESLQGFGSD